MTLAAHAGGLEALWAAAAPPAGSRFGDVLPWLVALLVLVCAGAVAIHVARRMARKADAPPEGFTIQDLRRLHGSGQLSDEEYERARAAVIGRVRQDAKPPARDDEEASA